MAAKKTETKTEEQALTVPQAPGALMNAPDYGDDYGEGFEDQNASDIMIPMVVLLQPLSPMCVEMKRDPNGTTAKPGLLLDTLSGILYEKIIFVPCYTKTMACKWKPRNDGGGFRGQLEWDDPRVQKAVKESTRFGRYRIDEPTEDKEGRPIVEHLELVETKYIYGVRCEGDQPIGPITIACTSSKIKPFKNWNTKLSQMRVPTPKGKVPPPMFAHLTQVFGVFDAGPPPFFNIELQPATNGSLLESLLPSSDDRYQLAKSMKQFITSGQAKVNYDQERAGGDDSSGGSRVDEEAAKF